jgi:hypothetical protein
MGLLPVSEGEEEEEEEKDEVEERRSLLESCEGERMERMEEGMSEKERAVFLRRSRLRGWLARRLTDR